MRLDARLRAYGLYDRFEVIQADACRLRCLDCGEEVQAEVVDLHVRRCPQ